MKWSILLHFKTLFEHVSKVLFQMPHRFLLWEIQAAFYRVVLNLFKQLFDKGWELVFKEVVRSRVGQSSVYTVQ